jgi:ATP-dependent exoDNAse (exonuclease V) alpha subunit
MTQAQALEILKTNDNVFLTGEPGAGKSYTINRFTEWANARGIYPAVTASTGIAATHIGGITIHSWAGIGIKDVLHDHDIDAILAREYVVRRILETRVLIIDEVSMLNGATLDNVDRVCREVRAIHDMTARSKPFGGIRVIFVGDFFQLPPVNKTKEKTQFAFDSDAWLNAAPKVCYLTEQHRQADPLFLEILTALRSGTLTKAHIDRLKKSKRKAPKDVMHMFTHNANVDLVNAQELAKLPGELKTFRMLSSGIPFLVDILKKNCLSPEVLELKIGAPVMFTRNDIQKDGSPGHYVNGTLGKIDRYDGSGRPVVVTNDGREIFFDRRAEWSIEEKNITKAQIEQYPLRLAWAITVHKSQGMSLDAARMDLSGAFEYGQGYVALSRVRSLAGLYLDGINDKALEMHPIVVKKDGLFRKISESNV